MIDRAALLKDLQRQVRLLEVDLRDQITEVEEVHTRLRAEYDRAFKVGRTAATWNAWRNERATQAAVAWILGTVFVRFCEDNGLLTLPFFAGPSKERMTLAEEAQEQYFRDHPTEVDRDWLLAAFKAIQVVEPGKFLFSESHNPLYHIPLSHDVAKALITFWRRRTDTGQLLHDFTDPEWDTRFLGDLYQDLSEAARKTYALLQTPEFVEEFILDRTLAPAIAEFGYDVVKLIDPTCGSGHFLLGAFRRLLAEWKHHSPAKDSHEQVRLALDAVNGVDINPPAVAIARFRLLIAALRAASLYTLAEASGYTFRINVAVGDSLIEHRQYGLTIDDQDPMAELAYATEDIHRYPGILDAGRYHVVVGNPPYVAVKDKQDNKRYRELYDACSGKYPLSVPFAQRFFQLARMADVDGRNAGYVSQITSNSFMKREFGRKLIEEFLTKKTELTYVIDTSGAYIPGHGTPTVILVGRNKDRRWKETVRVVLGLRGEPATPKNPAMGLAWTSIVDNLDNPGSETAYVTVLDLPRKELSRHPWSLSGGGAIDLKRQIEASAAYPLEILTESIGITSVTGEDDLYVLPNPETAARIRVSPIQRIVLGDTVRDWQEVGTETAAWPYDSDYQLQPLDDLVMLSRYLWPARTMISRRRRFGTPMLERGLSWYEWQELYTHKLHSTLRIAWGEVATHNHFVLDRGGKVFKQTAPVIKLRAEATEDDHIGLLGLLNSSTACFWLKQVSHNKGSTVDSQGARQISLDWESFYQFNSTRIARYPVPNRLPIALSRAIENLADQRAEASPRNATTEGKIVRYQLAQFWKQRRSARGRMIALQEELDWEVYRLYELVDEDLTAPAKSVPELQPGERAFEIMLARRMVEGEVGAQWFTRHGSTPITQPPEHWPAEYRAIVERRIALIEGNRSIALIERPECKRRWVTEGWEVEEARALRDWLLDRCEARGLWFRHVDGTEQPRVLTAAQLADELRRDQDMVGVAELYAPGKEFGKVIADLVAEEHVPYLAALRYKDTGVTKRADWEHVWDLQREEDEAATDDERRKIRNSIPVPPKYSSADFLKPSYWRHRGKLDVPKERFISYPGASRDGDPSLLLGWAGWDHREQAQALATLIVEREQDDGWDAERLKPLLGGLREVLPWVRQWHGEFDTEYGVIPAEVYDSFLAECQNRLHLTDDALTGWRPPKAARGRRQA